MMKLFPNTLIASVLIIMLLCIVKRNDATVYTCNRNVSCGCSMNSATVNRIVGGENASTGTWGWTVSIRIGIGSLCGGSIISSSWIITAAHCIESSRPSDYVVYAGSNARWSGTQNRTASQIITHPLFNSLTFAYDIALLQISPPLVMTDPYVSSICLPSVSQATLSAGEWPPVGTNVVTVGWGSLNENGGLPGTLQQVTLQTVSYISSTCIPVMANWRVQFCASVPNGVKDTCQGDSGGPMMMFTSSNQWVLVGLTSSGIGCARPQYAGLYTRVAAFQNWILANTNNTNSSFSFLNSTSSNNPNITISTNVTDSPSTMGSSITATNDTMDNNASVIHGEEEPNTTAVVYFPMSSSTNIYCGSIANVLMFLCSAFCVYHWN